MTRKIAKDRYEALALKYSSTDRFGTHWHGPVLMYTNDRKTFYWHTSTMSYMTLSSDAVEVLKVYDRIEGDDYERIEQIEIEFVTDNPPRVAIEDSAGWLASDGTFYPCDYGDHGDLAIDLLKLHHANDSKSGYRSAASLEKLGWCRVDAEYISPMDDLTQQQLTTLVQLYYIKTDEPYLNRHTLKDVLDYNNWTVK